jgi:hypothetical protein
MPIWVKRETLHQLIDNLPEPQLLEVARYVEFILAKDQAGASRFDLWVLPGEGSSTGGDDLNDLIRRIKNSSLDPQAITLPTKSWADYAAEMPQVEETPFDEATWNENWDAVETEMKAASLAHEEIERREQGL